MQPVTTSPSPMNPKTPASEAPSAGPSVPPTQVQDAGSSSAEAADALDQALRAPYRWVVVWRPGRDEDHTPTLRLSVETAIRFGRLRVPTMYPRDYLVHFLDECQGWLVEGCEARVATFDAVRGFYGTRPCGAIPAVRDEVEGELLCRHHADRRAQRVGIEGLVSP